MPGQKKRLVTLLSYIVLLLVVQFYFVGSDWPPTNKTIWLVSGALSLLIGKLMYPYFTPPLDGGLNGLLAGVLLLTAATEVWSSNGSNLLWLSAIGFCSLVFVGSIVAVWTRPKQGLAAGDTNQLATFFTSKLGSVEIVYTILIGCSIVWFHSASPTEIIAISFTWATILVLKPVEGIFYFTEGLWVRFFTPHEEASRGVLVAQKFPGLVEIRMPSTTDKMNGDTVVIQDQSKQIFLANSLHYKGFDDGDLYNCAPISLPIAIPLKIRNLVPKPQDVCLLSQPEIISLNLARDPTVCGFVNVNTDIGELRFETLSNAQLKEGQLVKVDIKEKEVLYQITNGIDREHSLSGRNTFGYIGATARKIGQWDYDHERFEPVPWLPVLNATVRILPETKTGVPIEKSIGQFPDTNYWCGINLTDAVTHNTAILGILGIGKSCLSLELVERMILDDIKVICLDLTNEYSSELSQYINEAAYSEFETSIRAAGGRGQPHINREEGGTINEVERAVLNQIQKFMENRDARILAINPAEFEIWRQDSWHKGTGTPMASLTPVEVTALITKAALQVSQSLGMTTQARLCLVYEEAHSLIPEWNAVIAEGDKAGANHTAKAILQGRKYGLGCVLITQRTANVTKTILNQCNTIFAMRTFDDTGKGFLANYIGSDYAELLPSIEARHAVFFGKASTCHNPVLIRLNDRDKFLEAVRKEPPIAPTEGHSAALPHTDLDDEIPF